MKYVLFFLILIVSVQSKFLYDFILVDVNAISIDTNADGKDDVFFKYIDGHDTTASDRNYDSEIDELVVFDELGLPVKLLSDDDFDKEFETVSYYKDGLIYKTEVDLGKDGEIEYMFIYKNGVIDEAVKYDWKKLDEKNVPKITSYGFSFGFPYMHKKPVWSARKAN